MRVDRRRAKFSLVRVYARIRVKHIIYMSLDNIHNWRGSGDICRNVFFTKRWSIVGMLILFSYERLKFMSACPNFKTAGMYSHREEVDRS